MRIANTELFVGWFSFQKTCADAAFYAVEMGICRDPVSLLGIVLWACAGVIFAAVMAVVLSTKGGRSNVLMLGAVGALGWLGYAANAKLIPDWITRSIGGVLLLAILGFVAIGAIQAANKNRRVATGIVGLYLTFVVILFFNFDRNLDDYWGEMLGLPIVFFFIIVLIVTPFVMLGKAISLYMRRSELRND